MANPLSFLGSLFTKAFTKAKAVISYLTSPSEATGDKESLLPKKGNEPPQPAPKLSPEERRQMDAFENAINNTSLRFDATTKAIDKKTISKTSSSAPSEISSKPTMAEPTGSGNVPQEEVERVQQAIRAQIGLDQSSPNYRSIQQIIAGKDSKTPQISGTPPIIQFQVEAPAKVAFKKTSGQGTDNQTSVTSENTVLTRNSRNPSEILSRGDPSSWQTYAALIAERNAKNGIGQDDRSRVVGPISRPEPQEEQRPPKTYKWWEEPNSSSRNAGTNNAKKPTEVQSTTPQRSTNRTNVSSNKENVNPSTVTKKAENVEKVETTKPAPAKSSKAQESSGAQESSKVPNNRATSRTLPALTKENLAEITASQNNNPKPKARSNSSSDLNPSSGSGSNPRSGSSLNSNPSSGSGSGSGSNPSFSPNPSFSSGSGSNPRSGSGSASTYYEQKMGHYNPEIRLMDKKEEEEYNAKKAFATQQRLRARVTKEGKEALAGTLDLHAIKVRASSDARLKKLNEVFAYVDVNPAPMNPKHQTQSEMRKPETLHRLANGPALDALKSEGWEVPYGHHATSPKGGGRGR